MTEKETNQIFNFIKSKKGQWLLVGILMLIILITSSVIRVQNLNLLEDETTGEKIPLALDPYYFLRVAETKMSSTGGIGELPEYDDKRVPFNVDWHPEILPESSIWIYKIGHAFNTDFTLRYAHVLNPVIFFILGLIAFFFLAYILTNSKIAALLSCGFLAFNPLYLYRTMAGFSDHESIGMFFFFLVLIGLAISLKYLDKNKKPIQIGVFGLLTGFLTALSIASWGGLAKFNFMIIPLSFLIFWFIERKKDKIKLLKKDLIYYSSWIVFSVLLTPLVSGHSMIGIINKYLMTSTGLISLFVLGFIIIDFCLIFLQNKKLINIPKKYSLVYSLGVLFVLGIVFLFIIGEISLIGEIFEKITNPFGSGRVGETVAENRSPSLEDWQNQTGKAFFWIFLLGLVLIGKKISEKIVNNKNRKIVFFLLWVLMLLGIIFSSHSSLNNLDFLKKFIYFGSVILFLGYLAFLDLKEKEFKIKPELIVIFSWILFMLIAARGAVRLFFVITPMICFSVSYGTVLLFKETKKYKDEIVKLILWVLAVLVILSLLTSFYNFQQSSTYQAERTSPSANSQWQQAMSWVRENTAETSIFLHWWDYGYWLQTLGNRATIVDGGHHPTKVVHMIGRYVLTTTQPETALSFIKSNNISYLLIDPTEIGKYSAYSRIGSGEEMKDRLSQIPTMSLVPSQTQETANETIRMYQGGTYVDEDIVYEKDEKEIFLPRNNAFIGGISLKTSTGEESGLQQPEGIFVYNGQQHKIPLRYVYYENQIYDFKSGLEATAYVLPKLNSNSQGLTLDEFGSVIYLSPKTMHSLVAELYLMNDAFDKYPELELVHKEQDQYLKYINAQGVDLPDFVNYQGLRGPIKIWNTQEIPEDIITHEEFAQKDPHGDNWEFGMLDDLEFRE